MTTFEYVAGEMVETNQNAPILVADSFLVTEGKVRSLDKHIVRLINHTALKAPELLPTIPDYIFQALNLVPRTGNHFPRLEIQTDNSLKIQLRPVPELTETVVLWTYPEADPRADLTVKGPELDLGATIRDQALKQGADEAILLTKEGFISEGALSSLVWWEGDILTAPDNEIPWLESITRTEVFEIAEKLGIKTQTKKAKPEELVGKEVWSLSSLQGIRAVSSWVNLSDNFLAATQKPIFDRELEALLVPLP